MVNGIGCDGLSHVQFGALYHQGKKPGGLPWLTGVTCLGRITFKTWIQDTLLEVEYRFTPCLRKRKVVLR